jgi:hypothetical protein
MRGLRRIGRYFKNFMIIFSFVVNVVLVLVILVLAITIFDLKNNVVTPLVAGLHSSFVGLDEATIDWTIPVRDDIQVKFDLPLNQETVVTLTEPVPLSVAATITLPGVGVLNNAQVFLQLPAGLQLPVQLDLTVPVDQQVPVSLDVRAVIPLGQTQLHDPVNNLRLVFEPIARALYNLPDNLGEAGQMVGDVLSGRGVNLLAESDYSRDPWVGFSRTAGFSYTLGSEPVPPDNVPVNTGIVVLGGIPALDQMLRPDLYTDGTPIDVNRRAEQGVSPEVPRYAYDGTYGDNTTTNVEMGGTGSPDDLGILPTPSAPNG